MNKQEKEELVNQLNSRLMNYPSDSWDRGHNEGLKSAVIVVSNLPTVDEPTKVIAHLAEHWDEDTGDVLWWNFPVEEPPYCGTPLDEHFPEYKTHFTTIDMPNEIEKPKQWVVKKSADRYFKAFNGIDFRSSSVAYEDYACLFADRAKAEAVALLVDGSVEEVAE